jgi:hypothetical protein
VSKRGRNPAPTAYEEPEYRYLRRNWLIECDRRRAADERTDLLIAAIKSGDELVAQIALSGEPRRLLIQRQRDTRNARGERWIVG